MENVAPPGQQHRPVLVRSPRRVVQIIGAGKDVVALTNDGGVYVYCAYTPAHWHKYPPIPQED